VIFSSIEFFVLLLLVLGIVGLTRSEEARRNVLLAASYVFYGWWDWRFCFLMWITSTIDYAVAIQLERETREPRRRAWLVFSLIANLGILATFKYTNFFLDSARPLLAGMGLHVPHLDILLPVGISFFTFQSMSYTIDVYWRKLPATRNYRDFVLFVAFFPQLVAGPIVRGSQFLPQLGTHQHALRWDNLRRGVEIFVRGFVKKVLLADTFAVAAEPVFAHPSMFAPAAVWVAVLAYAGQIYYDFSGYSDMAIGCGRMFGFEFPRNFDHPYLSRSITEFWRRWHISLSTWLRDYLYIPLGGNRRGRGRTYLNLAATMLLGGLWHGASWTFVVWGGLHGLALAADKFRLEITGSRPDDHDGPVRRFLGWATTFLIVLVCWVFFRAQTFGDAWIVLRKMAFLDRGGADWFHLQAVAAIGVAVAAHLAVKLRGERELLPDLRRPLAWTATAAALLLVLLFAPFNANPFIYFQF
jgi:alginate O-acetyltransferase complex protein AlgI